jgi:hypothetical protein
LCAQGDVEGRIRRRIRRRRGRELFISLFTDDGWDWGWLWRRFTLIIFNAVGTIRWEADGWILGIGNA